MKQSAKNRIMKVVIFTLFTLVLSVTSSDHDDFMLLQRVAAQRDIRASTAILDYSIDEQLPVGTLVANLSRDVNQTADRCQFDCASTSTRYVLLPNQRHRHGASFALNSTSGLITTSGVVDREAICFRRDVVCSVLYDVAVQRGDVFDMFRVRITINDVNDHAPQFPPPSVVHISISESTLPDEPSAIFPLPVAVDADSIQFGVVEYRLEMTDNDTDNHFRLSVASMNTSEPEVKLALVRPLDREVRAEYQLSLVAYDGGLPVQSGALSILVEVEDVNDNSPSFEQSVYDIEVSESAPIGSTLLTAVAVDPDSEHNGRVTYRMSARGQGRDDFRIDDATGHVTLVRKLDCVRQSSYAVGLVAADHGVSSRSTYATLNIRVVDVNDHAPVVTLHAGDVIDSDHVIVRAPPIGQHAAVETFVAHLSVTDSDSGDNGRVTCSVDDVTIDDRKQYVLHSDYSTSTAEMTSRRYSFRLTELYDKEFKLTMITRPLSHQHGGQYKLSITCRDHGTPSYMTSSSVVSVTVLTSSVDPSHDIHANLELPTIVYPTTADDMVRVSAASLQVGHVITAILAQPGGDSTGGRLAFELVDGNASNYFRVDRSSGHVVVIRPFESPDADDVILQLVLGVSQAGNSSTTTLSLATLFVVIEHSTTAATPLPVSPTSLGRHGYDSVGLLIRLGSGSGWSTYTAIFVGCFVVLISLVLFVAAFIVCRRRRRQISRDQIEKMTSAYHVAFEFSPMSDVCALNNGTMLMEACSLDSLADSAVSAGTGSSNNSFLDGKLSNIERAHHYSDVTRTGNRSPLPDIVLFDHNATSQRLNNQRMENSHPDCTEQCVAAFLPSSRSKRCILCDAAVRRSRDDITQETEILWRPPTCDVIVPSSDRVQMTSPDRLNGDSFNSTGKKRVRFAPPTIDEYIDCSPTTSDDVIDATEQSTSFCHVTEPDVQEKCSLTLPEDGSLV